MTKNIEDVIRDAFPPEFEEQNGFMDKDALMKGEGTKFIYNSF